MTPTRVLPDQLPIDALARPTLQNHGAGTGAGQGGQFPELLGRLMGQQAATTAPQLQFPASGERGAEGAVQSALPWQVRVMAAISGEVAGTGVEAQRGAEPTPNVTGELPLPVEQLGGHAAVGAIELLADAHGGVPGEVVRPDAAAAMQAEAGVPAPAEQRLIDAEAVLLGASLPVAAENAARAAPAGSNAQVSHTTRERRAGSNAETTVALAAKAGPAKPQTAMPMDGGAEAVLTARDGGAKQQEAAPAIAGETKLAVVRTETHLPVAGQAPPMQQIAERIGAELVARAGDRTDHTGGHHVGLQRPAVTPEPVVKVLHIQLQPAELGMVTVRMSLKGDALQVQLDASRQDTAQLMRQDREALSKALQSAGYALEGLAVHVVESDRGASVMQHASQSNTPTGQASVQSQPHGLQPDGRASDMQQHNGRDGQRHQPAHADNGGNAGGDPAGRRASPGGVYL